MQLRGGDDDHFGGIDIGGTKIGVCLGRGDGRILGAHRFATDHTLGPSLVLAQALAALDALATQHGAPRALGVACPGPITVAGRFLDPPNMPRWHGFDLAAWLRAHTKTPATTMNDANAGVLAEWLWGAARGADTAVFCTMSTGMGAGLIVGGELHQGRTGFAAEIGHLRLAPDGPVGFGKRGSVEGFLSGPGIVQVAEQEAKIALQTGAATGLLHDGRVRELSAETVCGLARTGDAAAARAIARCADKLGELLAVLVDLLEPDVIVLGTIAASHPDLFLDRAWARLREEALAHSLAHLRVEVTSLTDRGDRQAIAAARYAGRG